MSRYYFRGGSGHNVAELQVDTTRLSGTGGTEYPTLHWQLQLVCLPLQNPSRDIVFRNVEANISLPQSLKIADARPIFLQRVMRGYQPHQSDEYLNLEFPLDARRIEAIERHRQGRSLKVRLDMRLAVEEYGVIPAHEESKRPKLWGLSDVQWLYLQEEIQIPQEQWAEHVLPRIGHGKVIVVEFPAAPLDGCERLANSLKALKQAEDKHRLGFYDDAVGKCRVALEPFFDYEAVDPTHPESRKVPVLKRSWETKLGKATYTWLDGALGALKDASNPPHHSPSARYDQSQSQMILAITAAVVTYVARNTELGTAK